jgi:hypothetical protein
VLIGSVSLHCVAHADCPVVILRGPEGPSRTGRRRMPGT